MTEVKYGVLAGEPEIIGERCMDGGTCHHKCQQACFRKECCSPLAGAGLNNDWSMPKLESKWPLVKEEDVTFVSERSLVKETEYVLYGYATPSGKLYASSLDALSNGEQSWVKVYVNKEDLK